MLSQCACASTSLPRCLILELFCLLRNHFRHTLRPICDASVLLCQSVLPRAVLLVTHLQFPQPPLPFLLAIRLCDHLLVIFPLHAVLFPVQISNDQHGDCERLCVQTSAEVQVGRLVVALAHASGGAHDGPDGEPAAEGNKRFFAETAPYLVKCVFIVKVAGRDVRKRS
jgi:hypothetical protein